MLITFVIVSFIFVVSCWILISKAGSFIKDLGPLVEQWTIIAEKMSNTVQTAQNINSGVVGG